MLLEVLEVVLEVLEVLEVVLEVVLEILIRPSKGPYKAFLRSL